ncbi:GNAT family N-acetyltransferase [Paenibacillus albidus]|uniref:GNAT family N-acetyltransferase n=1 Tax=Paenibacillus albidus TaxID=2041023 RepID=UPI001BEA512A|nr:GNAT family N-acetyltransferase [Paenibacillus albidus]MBT2288156.1 GNAT family N-acetyltransferase [Paenibacillus albidus]
MEIKETEYEMNQKRISALLEQHGHARLQDIPPYERQTVSLAAYEHGAYAGGITGEMVWSILHVHLLAVDEAYRGHGVGALLLEQMEALAKAQGCKVSELTTMSWQAPGFYQKQGYEIFGEIQDCPLVGQTKFYLKKQL